MSDEAKPKTKPTDPKKRNYAAIWRTWKAFIFVGIGTAIILGVIVGWGFSYFTDRQQRVEFITLNTFSALIFTAIVFQIIVYKAQCDAMERQGDAMHGQLDGMRSSLSRT